MNSVSTAFSTSRRRAVVALAALILPAVAACRDRPTEPVSTPVWPLAVGEAWIYRVVETDSAGTIVQARDDTLRVLDERTYAGERWLVVNRHPAMVWIGNFPELTRLVRNGSTGLFFCVVGGGAATVFKSPARVDDKYSGSFYGPDWAYVLAIDTPQTVPAGTFRTTLYEMRDASRVWSRYFVAPGFGLVRVEVPAVAGDPSASDPRTRKIAVDLLRREGSPIAK